jgi:hypothetical protein
MNGSSSLRRLERLSINRGGRGSAIACRGQAVHVLGARHRVRVFRCSSMRLTSSGGRFRCLRAWSITAAVSNFAGSNSLTVKALQPCLLAAGQALKLRAAHVPQFDVDAVRTALAEEEDSHSRSLATKRIKGKDEQITPKT